MILFHSNRSVGLILQLSFPGDGNFLFLSSNSWTVPKQHQNPKLTLNLEDQYKSIYIRQKPKAAHKPQGK